MKISAVNGDGLDELLLTIEKLIKSFKKHIKVLIPYSDGRLTAMLYSRCEVIKEEHTENGLLADVFVDEEMENRLESCTVLKEIQ